MSINEAFHFAMDQSPFISPHVSVRQLTVDSLILYRTMTFALLTIMAFVHERLWSYEGKKRIMIFHVVDTSLLHATLACNRWSTKSVADPLGLFAERTAFNQVCAALDAAKSTDPVAAKRFLAHDTSTKRGPLDDPGFRYTVRNQISTLLDKWRKGIKGDAGEQAEIVAIAIKSLPEINPNGSVSRRRMSKSPTKLVRSIIEYSLTGVFYAGTHDLNNLERGWKAADVSDDKVHKKGSMMATYAIDSLNHLSVSRSRSSSSSSQSSSSSSLLSDASSEIATPEEGAGTTRPTYMMSLSSLSFSSIYSKLFN